MKRAGVALTVALLACGCRPADLGNDVVPPTEDAGAVDTGPDAVGRDPGDSGDPHLGARAAGAVFVHLFEWKWLDIASECEQYLGPNGFAAVQVSPPSEHAVLAGQPWWQRYQTVSYSLARSRSGTASEFKAMVDRCAAVGVGIYVDAVINHMTGQTSGLGSNGTAFTKYSYPNLYTAADFHMPPCSIADSDYADAPDRVRTCELVGLADLNTSADHVRDEIAQYLASLVELGVRGFRIDAAKHIATSDLDAILRRVSGRVGDQAPYFFLEVIDPGGEAIHATDYLPLAPEAAATVDLTEFKYATVAEAFLGAQGRTLAGLRTLGATSADFLPSARAVVFVNNHDTQRASSLYYANGSAYDLATVFLLAWPYGYPSLLSSYAFDRSTAAGRAIGPPEASPPCSGGPPPAAATSGWLCEHRRSYVPGLLAFRKKTAAAPAITNWWDDGANAIAFGRGALGFVVINNGTTDLHRTLPTGLPAGAYCDVYPGPPTATGCAGARVSIGADGMADLSVAAGRALVLHVGAPAAP